MILHILYKYYGGIAFFENKPISLLNNCINYGIKKEQEIPKLIYEIFKYISVETSELEAEPINKHMRSREEILKDYGMI